MKSKMALAWLLNYIAIASVSATIITPALPKIQMQWHLSAGIVEWVVSAFLLGYVLGQLIYGPIANAYGRLQALRLGLSINLVGILLCLLASHQAYYGLLMLGRFITGLGAASGLACTFMLINEWIPEESRKTAIAYSLLSSALSTGLAVFIGGLLTEHWYWPACFIFLLLHGLILLGGSWVFTETLKKPKPIQVAALARDYLRALSNVKLVIFSMLIGTCSMIGYCFAAAAPQIAHEYLKISITAYGYWNGINIIGLVIGGLSARELLQRFPIYQVIGLGFLGYGLSILSLVCLWQSGGHLSAWFFITTAMLYLFNSYLFAGGSHIASNALEDKANASSMMSFVNTGFATLSLIIMSYLSHDAFLAFISILSIVFVLTVGLLILYVVNTRT